MSQHLKKISFLLWVSCPATPSTFLQNATFKNLNESYYCYLADVLKELTTFNIITGCLLAFLPFLIVTVLYTKVCLKLWSRQVSGEGSNQNAQQAEAIKTARKNYTDDDCYCCFVCSVLASYAHISYSGAC